MGVIDQIFQTDCQLANQWDLLFDDDTLNMQFRITSVSLPEYSFSMETLMSGEKIYKTLEEVEELSITLRESPFFDTYTFFSDWRNSIFDFETRSFKKHTDNTHLKSLSIVFYQLFPLSLSPSMAASLGTSFLPGLSTAASSITNLGTDVASQAGFDIPIGRKSMVFRFQNCKIEKIEPITLDYDGKPLEFTVSLKPELMYTEYTSGPIDKVNNSIKKAKGTINSKIRSRFK